MDASVNAGGAVMMRKRMMMIVRPPALDSQTGIHAGFFFFRLTTFYVHTEGLRIHTQSRIHT